MLVVREGDYGVSNTDVYKTNNWGLKMWEVRGVRESNIQRPAALSLCTRKALPPTTMVVTDAQKRAKVC